MAAGSAGHTKLPEIKVKIPTKKLIVGIVTMYQSDDETLQKSAIELAKYVTESYDSYSRMQHDIFEAFVSSKQMLLAMQKDFERRFPKEVETLKIIFGAALFGG